MLVLSRSNPSSAPSAISPSSARNTPRSFACWNSSCKTPSPPSALPVSSVRRCNRKSGAAARSAKASWPPSGLCKRAEHACSVPKRSSNFTAKPIRKAAPRNRKTETQSRTSRNESWQPEHLQILPGRAGNGRDVLAVRRGRQALNVARSGRRQRKHFPLLFEIPNVHFAATAGKQPISIGRERHRPLNLVVFEHRHFSAIEIPHADVVAVCRGDEIAVG